MTKNYINWKIEKEKLNYIGQDEDLQKQAQEAQDEYSNVANWCNEGQEYHIEEIGDEYRVVKNPEPTQEELKQQRIFELKQLLANADYWGQKYLDGEYTEEEWAEKVAQRKAWREEIRQLEVA